LLGNSIASFVAQMILGGNQALKVNTELRGGFKP